MDGSNEVSKSLIMVKQLLEYIAKSVVNKPEHVHVRVEEGSDGKKNMLIAVDSQDMGKIIGRNGQTIKAIRALVAAVVPGQNISVDIVK